MGSPSPELINDFLNFYNSLPKRVSINKIISELSLNAKRKQLIYLLNDFQNGKYNKVINSSATLYDFANSNLTIYSIISDCYRELNQYQKSDSLCRFALNISCINDDLESQAEFLTKLGYLSTSLQNYDQAICFYDSAYTIAKRIADFNHIQIAAGNLGFLYKNNNKLDSAEVLLKEALNLSLKLKKNKYSKIWYSFYGQVLYLKENYNEALKAYDVCENLARKVNDMPLFVRLKLNKGDIYFYLKQNNLAKILYNEAFELAKINKFVLLQHRANVRLANLLIDEKKYNEARNLYESYIDYFSQTSLESYKAYGLWKLAQIFGKQKKYEQAKNTYLRAIEAAKKCNSNWYIAWSLIEIAEIEINNRNIKKAQKIYAQILDNYLQTTDYRLLAETYLKIGKTYMLNDEINNAITAYIKAAYNVEQMRNNLKVEQFRIGYFSENDDIYRELVNCYFKQYQKNPDQTLLDSLFIYDQLLKSRTLNEIKFKKNILTKNNYNQESFQDYIIAKENLRKLQRSIRIDNKNNAVKKDPVALKSQLEAARYSLLAQQLRLVNYNYQDSTFNENLSSPSLSKIKSNTEKSDFGMLLYHISKNVSFVLIIKPESTNFVQLNISPGQVKASIDSLTAPFHNVKSNAIQDIPFNANIAHQLYKSLIQPIEESIQLPEKLIIIPDISIMNLPFEMLLSSKPDSSVYFPTDFSNYTDSFLLHRYSFTYSPGTSLLQLKSKPISNTPDFVIFANPFDNRDIQSSIYSEFGWSFSPLPFSVSETKGIKKIYDQVKVYSNSEATKSNFIKEAPGQQIIHLATHGFVDLSFDAFSGLVLATNNDSTDDGLLMGYEIADMSLNCDLVTLSACETGRGKVIAGEGVLGLPRLFLKAGAKTVLMTMWKVDDHFTSELMPKFYDYFLNQGESKSDALRLAKRDLIKTENRTINYKHPFFWASFCLFGEPGVQKKQTKMETYLSLKIIILFIVLIIMSYLAFCFYQHKKI